MKKFFAWFFALLLTGSLILFGVCLVGHQVIAPAMGDEGAPVSDSLIREEKDLARERITALADLYGFDPEPVVAAVNEDVLKDLNSQASLWWSSVLRDGRAGNELRWDTKEVEQILMEDPAVQEKLLFYIAKFQKRSVSNQVSNTFVDHICMPPAISIIAIV